jgi:hypothetical protein
MIQNLRIKVIKLKFRNFSKYCIAALLLSPVSTLSAQAAETTMILKYPDSTYNVNWVVEIKFQQSIQCSWGSGDPATKVAASCSIPLTYKMDWEVNTSAGAQGLSQPWTPSSSYLSPIENNLIVMDRTGTNLDTGSFNSASLYGNRYEVKPLTLSANIDANKEFTFGIKTYSSPKPLFSIGNVVYGQLVVPSKSQAISDYAAAQAAQAAAAKAASDKAAADRKAELDRQAASQAAKKITITCQKGSQKKIVKGDPAKCPAGFSNPQDKFLTFKAFSACKLYKKDLFLAPARLEDGGKTLTLPSVGKYSYMYNGLTYQDMSCALSILGTPSFVVSQIDTTRALDGMQRATWGKIAAAWTYHPDNGANITFNSK